MSEKESIRPYQYVLFDLDGTLTDSKEGITKCAQYALEALGIREPDLDKLEAFVGPPLTVSFRDFYGLEGEDCRLAIEKFRERLVEKGLYENSLYPGIRELLEELQSAGILLAVASSKPQVHIKIVLEYFDIASYFAVVVGSELDGTRSSKEEVVEEALRQVAAMSGGFSRGVMVGDRKYDVEGAKAHGLPCVGVRYGCAAEGELEAAGAECIAADAEELGRILLGKPQ